MLILIISFFILVMISWLAKKLNSFGQHLSQADREKRHYREELLSAAKRIASAVPEEDPIEETLAALKALREKQEDRKAVDELIENL